MASITPTADLIETILDGISYVESINSFVDNGDGTITISVDDTLHARPLGKLTIDATLYPIVSVVNGVSITYTGDVPVIQSYLLASPFYFHGTPIMINAHLSRILNDRDKFPMVYLLEIMRETFDTDPESSIDRTSDVTLFVMDIANYEQWTTDQHYTDAINPMRNLVQSFVDAVDNKNGVGKFGNYTTISHANFGIYFTNQGHESPIFNEKISGVELQVSLPFKKDCNC